MYETVPETQFSIYKIDPEKVIAIFFTDNDTPTNTELLRALNNSVKAIITKRKKCDEYAQLKYMGFTGYLYKTTHEPDWKDIFVQILNHNALAKTSKFDIASLNNTNISYVLFYDFNNSIYVMTGGFGSKLIEKFIVKNYGLYLLPKFLKKESAVVKHVNENNLIGNLTSTHRTNRTTTSFFSEQDLSSIYKDLGIELDRDLSNVLGIEFNEEESSKKHINLLNKDSLVIRRSLSLNDLVRVLQNINMLEKKKDKFALNYLVHVKKKGIKKSDLTQQLVEEFKDKEYARFILVGDDFESYILSAYKYRILKEDGEVFIESTEPITLGDIFNKLIKQNIRFSHLLFQKILKEWNLSTFDHNGRPVLSPHSLIDVIQGFIEFGEKNKPCYLINGDWYTFDESYDVLLSKEYQELYKHKNSQAVTISEQFKLKIPSENETAYNEALDKLGNIIVSHKTLFKNVEFADAIFWNETTLFLMHNKGKFNGIGTRDLLNQMLTAAECLQMNKGTNGYNGIAQYYRAICKQKKLTELPMISKDEFIKLFNTRKICYIAGFVSGYKPDSHSPYAKYLTLEINKRMSKKGFDFIPLGIN